MTGPIQLAGKFDDFCLGSAGARREADLVVGPEPGDAYPGKPDPLEVALLAVPSTGHGQSQVCRGSDNQPPDTTDVGRVAMVPLPGQRAGGASHGSSGPLRRQPHPPQAPADPQPPAAPLLPAGAATTTTPMEHGYCPGETDVPPVLPRPRRRPAHSSAVALSQPGIPDGSS